MLKGCKSFLTKVEERANKEKINQLVEIVHHFYKQRWAVGTSGNFSVVLEENPLQIAITPSGIHKETLSNQDFIVVNGKGEVLSQKIPAHTPSAEMLVHLAIIQSKNVNAVFHLHTIWSTAISDLFPKQDHLAIKGYEMLKGLHGIKTHDHEIFVPILDNSQDMRAFSEQVHLILHKHPEAQGFVVKRHGFYTWGEDLLESKRHVEIFEFLFESVGRLKMCVR